MKAKRRSRELFLFLAVVLFCAVGLWLFWGEITWRIGSEKRTPFASKPAAPAQERIFEDDRRRLNEVIQERKSN